MLRKLTPPARGRITFHDEGSPLRLRVTPNGTKSFFVTLRTGHRHIIGHFGTVTLADAREAARRLKAEKTLGRILPQSVSFPEVRKRYLDQKDIRPNTRDYTVRHLNRLHATKLGDITPRDITRILDKQTASSRTQAIRVYSAFFNWCIRQSYMDVSPVARMQAGQSNSRARVLTDDELKRVWIAADDCRTFGVIVKLLALTGQRRGEIAALQSSWIHSSPNSLPSSNGATSSGRSSSTISSTDLWTITLPASVTKNGREHTFPIGETAALLICNTQTAVTNSGLLFAARGKPNSSFNGWSKSKAALDKAANVYGWTLHDIRRTVATRLAEMGVAPHVIERLLNHVSGQISGVAAVYNRAKYMEEMREAVQAWEGRLKILLSQP